MVKLIGAPTLDDALSALGREVAAREAAGEKNLVFCEDRLTLLAERAVLAARGGSFLTEVSTFKRFLSREERVLSKQGSVAAISAILSGRERELSCFRRSAAEAVYETIAQLAASRVTPGDLLRSAAEAEGVLGAKLRDLALLFEAYEAFLHERGLYDESGYLALLPEAIGQGVGDRNVFFFAFPSFTRQALSGVEAAIASARSVTGIFLAGEDGAYSNEAARAFSRLTGEKRRDVPSTARGEAELLRKGLFAGRRALPRRAEHVFTLRADDEAEEMNAVAALISKYVKEGKRYRDLAVLVPDASYFLAAAKAFGAYRIPCFMDMKRPYSEHPFCAFALAAIRAAGNGVLPEEADDVASSVYFGPSGGYRNYLLRFGAFRGGALRPIKTGDAVKEYDGEELARCRERMRAVVGFFRREGTGSDYAEGVRALYRYVDGDAVTLSLMEGLTGEEKAFLGAERLEGVLSEIVEVAGGQRFSAREFADLLESGLRSLNISMVPQYADAVFVGDITESRLRRADVLFCVGLTDAVPRVSEDAALLSDRDIGRLGELSVIVEPAIAVVNERAREAMALNLCAFNEALYLSCPARFRGEEARRSEALFEIERLLTSMPAPSLFPYDCAAPMPAVLTFLRMEEGDGHGVGEAERSRRRAAIREALEGRGADPQDFLSADGKPPVPEAADLYFSREVSPTLLEEYFACPYRGFARRALRLKERNEGALDGAEAGVFVHAVLETVAHEFNDIADEAACRARAEEEADALLASRFSRLRDTAAGSYTAERLKGEAAAVTVAAYGQLKGSSYRVRAAEAEIVLPELGLKGKADRVDESGELVRVIDYKTGKIDETAGAYYTGRKLQLELYLRAAAREGKAAGAFYFPAADEFAGEGEERFRMRGFWCEEDVPAADGGGNGARRTDRGMAREAFEDFLDYSVAVSEGAKEEMERGNVTPSPYEDCCEYCKLLGMCGFTGAPRRESDVKCAEIAAIARRHREEKP